MQDAREDYEDAHHQSTMSKPGFKDYFNLPRGGYYLTNVCWCTLSNNPSTT